MESSVSRQRSPSELVIHTLYEITSHYDAGFESQVQELIQLGLDCFGLDIGIVSRIEDDEYEVVSAVAPKGVRLEKGDTFPLGDTYCSITLAADGPVGFECAGESTYAGPPAYGLFKLESYIGIPARVGARARGTLHFPRADARARKFDQVDVDCLRLMESWLSTESRRQELEDELREAHGRLEQLVRTDPLTELANRRGLEASLQRLTRRSAFDDRAVSCVLIDIDDFKDVNDTFGHAAGDRVIRAVADQVRSCLRPGDVAARVGGDEFVAVIDASPAEAEAIARRIAAAVDEMELEDEGRVVTVSVSIGVSEVAPETERVTELLEQAQSLLRDSKRAGKNTVTAA